jgi:hypothetical protein
MITGRSAIYQQITTSYIQMKKRAHLFELIQREVSNLDAEAPAPTILSVKQTQWGCLLLRPLKRLSNIRDDSRAFRSSEQIVLLELSSEGQTRFGLVEETRVDEKSQKSLDERICVVAGDGGAEV